jgi:predicted MFS family arabinose efflux permease
MLAGSGVWALLPLVARDHLGTGASGYGLLLSAFGVGSVAGALFIPSLRRRFATDPMAAVSLAVFSLCVTGVGTYRSVPLVAAAMFVAGLSWIVVAVNHNVSVQLCSPDGIRGRMISFYLISFQGSLAMGSWMAGWIADRAGSGVAIVLSGVLCAGGLLLIPRFPITQEERSPGSTP